MADEKTISQVLLVGSIVLSFLSFVLGGTLGGLIALLLLGAVLAPMLGFLISKYGYWMIPFLTRGQRTIQTGAAVLEVVPTEDAIVKRMGDGYFATIYLGVKIYKTTTSMSPDEKLSFQSLWERSISGIGSVVKYGVLLYIKDLSRYKESIETRKAKAQLELSKLQESPSPDTSKMDPIEREISMWDGMLSRLGIGEKPTAIITFVQATAKGATKDGAIAAAKQLANEIRSTVGTALNVEVAVLTGEDMRRCYDWSLSIPSEVKEL